MQDKKTASSDKKKLKVPGWIWPIGVLAAGFAGAATVALRGCWHQMSWPIRITDEHAPGHGDEGYAYQICTKCGIMRLYDDQAFHPYGPHGYDLHELIARERASRRRRSARERTSATQAPATTPEAPAE